MSFQVLRSDSYTVGALHGLGYEAERTEEKYQKNKDIEESLTHLNFFYKHSAQGFYQDWKRILKDFGISSKVRKTSKAVVGFVITSDEDFFKSLGWRPGMGMTQKVQSFFNAAYDWIKAEYGFHQGDRNIISAAVHFDERVPHLHVYLLPIVDRWREKEYQRGADGKILRSSTNSPLTVVDGAGHTVYKEVTGAPRLNRSEFFNQRGGRDSYRYMQNCFFRTVGEKFKLDRGEVGSDRRHISKQDWEKRRAAEITAAVSQTAALSGVKIPFFSRTLITDKDLALLKEDARQYRLNRDNILKLSEQLDTVRSREKSVSKAAREVHRSAQTVKDELDWINRDKARLANEHYQVEKLKAEYNKMLADVDDLVKSQLEEEQNKLIVKRIDIMKKQIELEKNSDSVFAEKLAAVVAEKDIIISERDVAISQRDVAISERDAAISQKTDALKRIDDLSRTCGLFLERLKLVTDEYNNMLIDYNKMKEQFIENDKLLKQTADEMSSYISDIERVRDFENFIRTKAPDLIDEFINCRGGIVD